MRVLLSINPNFVEKIFSGEKQYEYRRVIFKREIDTIVVYSTNPEGKIVGEFEVEDILFGEIETIWATTEQCSGIDYSFFKHYFRDRTQGYAIKIGRPRLYDSPLDLKEIGESFRPPQSFCYID